MIKFPKENHVLPVCIEISKILIHSFLSQNVTVKQIIIAIIFNIITSYCRDFLVIILPNVFLFMLFVFVNNGYIICKITTNKNPNPTRHSFSEFDYIKHVLSNNLLNKCSSGFNISFDHLSELISNDYQKQNKSEPTLNLKERTRYTSFFRVFYFHFKSNRH